LQFFWLLSSGNCARSIAISRRHFPPQHERQKEEKPRIPLCIELYIPPTSKAASLAISLTSGVRVEVFGDDLLTARESVTATHGGRFLNHGAHRRTAKSHALRCRNPAVTPVQAGAPVARRRKRMFHQLKLIHFDWDPRGSRHFLPSVNLDSQFWETRC
jgi:hypothetical protein